jgi:ATP/maltotriose-dependent transcriptional regulator MalT
MKQSDTLQRARESFFREEWGEAYARLKEADDRAPLAPDDLERFATAAWLVGEDAESVDLWERAHQEFIDRGDPGRACHCAFWLGLGLNNRGDRARGGGWIARARRLLDEIGQDCVERGYVLLPSGLQELASGDSVAAYDTFVRAAEFGARFGDVNLTALARLGLGQTLIRSGEIHDGVSLLDEVMVAVRADRMAPMVVGLVYCAVIESCQEIFDLRRAQEWTEALSDWCESQPDLVPYRGQCLVRRSEIMQVHGAWAEAEVEAQRACERLAAPPGEAAAGAAFYQRAELHRLRGKFSEAEEAYRQASRWGRKPQPGLALLRLACGDIDAASATIRRVTSEAGNRRTRSRVLPACVEIMLAAGDLEAARAAADELQDIAAEVGAPLLRATADHARGVVLLAEGDSHAALKPLRAAWETWEEMEAPYEAARVRVPIGLACRALGDEDTAELELDAARWVFQQVGAAPELIRLDALTRAADPENTPGGDHRLTSRELQVLRRVAAGSTNKSIAAELFISERTVERHLSNIFTKLGVSSRTAATTFAYEHQFF